MAHALVFGASGILGWAVVDQILKNYPQKGTFSKVTALTNRPLDLQDSQWPEPGGTNPELALVSGVDLTRGTVEDIKQQLKERVPDIGTVTQIFYFAYIFHPDFPTEQDINVAMFDRGFVAAEALAPNLSYVILPTGTKGYGIHQPKRPFKAPFDEAMNDIPQPYRDVLFYFALRDRLDALQKGKRWKWAEVRCDIVVGFLPHSNPYNLAGFFINYLSLVAFVQGRGAKVPYPGHPDGWHTLSNDGGQDTVARFSLYLSVNPDKAGTSELYNIADTSDGYPMSAKWPAICEYFGLVGVPPLPLGDPTYVSPAQYLEQHKEELRQMESQLGNKIQQVDLMTGLDIWLMNFDFDHHLALGKARSVGFVEEGTVTGSWIQTFDRYRAARKLWVAS
ncbi:hypothetical protein AYO21_00630 [Fonsecaea monophora]|uniref:PRISE-like Rossmann-fold domain-containing protein n=1 Tax=Fonsecaea monophora TaxID=254056 RepID=A0A177FPK5_9EURO|nr:hypothetical protein AYO21_00630 [Fonsecaea monophora]KAH0840716.1 sirQ protein [Fonsecaea pedrosoi]OAG45282.1 hypothetical protein AYO21_00630 [Fonsecaea monophora]